MSDQSFDNSIEGLLERLAVDELDESQWADLAARIADDGAARRSFVETVHWRHSLAYIVGRGTDSKRQTSVPRGPGLGESVDTPSARGEADPRSPIWRIRHLFGNWMVAATIAFVLGAGVTTLAVRGWNETHRAHHSSAVPELMPATSSRPLSPEQQGQIGKVTGLSLEASADGLTRSLQVGQELRCGEVVQFTQGFMRVALADGPQLIIEGPAEFSLVARDAVFVRYGRVSASDASSMLLQSPLLMAECKDADVAFLVDEDSATSLYAYRGLVAMRTNARAGELSEKLGSLHAGEGAQVSANVDDATLRQRPADPPNSLVRTWSEVEATLLPYETLVLSDRPLAYWPLYHVRRNRRVLDLTQHGYDGQAIGNWPLELDENLVAGERGAHFNGESYIEPDRKPPVDARRGFSVEGWAKVQGGPAFQSIFTSRWVLDTFTPQRQCLGYTLYAGDNDRWQFWTGNGRYGELWNELHTEIPVARGEWTHLVATFDPLLPVGGTDRDSVTGTVRLYVDGQLAAEGQHQMSLVDFQWPARIGAAEFVPNSLTAWLFRGQLRDIAVYDYCLEAERVSAHYDEGSRRTDTIGRAAVHKISPSLTRS